MVKNKTGDMKSCRNARVAKALIILLTLASIAISAGCGEEPRVEWGKDIDEALALAKELRKPVMIDFMATWCPPCHAMEDSTFSAPEVIEKSRSFVPVRIDVDEQREVAVAYGGNARKYGGVGIPNILFLDADGGKLKHVVGYHGPEQFVSVIDTVLAMLHE
jgi:thiol:disulfide interchange protein